MQIEKQNELYYYKTNEQDKKIQIYMKTPGMFGDNEGLCDEKIGTIKYNDDIKQYEFHKSIFLERMSHEIIKGLDNIMTDLDVTKCKTKFKELTPTI